MGSSEQRINSIGLCNRCHDGEADLERGSKSATRMFDEDCGSKAHAAPGPEHGPMFPRRIAGVAQPSAEVRVADNQRKNGRRQSRGADRHGDGQE